MTSVPGGRSGRPQHFSSSSLPETLMLTSTFGAKSPKGKGKNFRTSWISMMGRRTGRFQLWKIRNLPNGNFRFLLLEFNQPKGIFLFKDLWVWWLGLFLVGFCLGPAGTPPDKSNQQNFTPKGMVALSQDISRWDSFCKVASSQWAATRKGPGH